MDLGRTIDVHREFPSHVPPLVFKKHINAQQQGIPPGDSGDKRLLVSPCPSCPLKDVCVCVYLAFKWSFFLFYPFQLSTGWEWHRPSTCKELPTAVSGVMSATHMWCSLMTVWQGSEDSSSTCWQFWDTVLLSFCVSWALEQVHAPLSLPRRSCQGRRGVYTGSSLQMLP